MSALSDARVHLRKAREFLEAAELNLDFDLYNAATSSAVTSGINAKDAVCLALTGTTSSSENHIDAVAERRGAGPAARPLAPSLGRLLKLKNKAQYQTVGVARSDCSTPSRRPRRPRTGSRWAVVAVAALVVAVAAACGDDADATDDADPPEEVTTPDEAPLDEAPVEDTVPDEREEPEAADAAWEQVAVDGEEPPARAAAVLVASPDGSLWLHGGSVAGEALDDLWRFDGERWARVDTEGRAPPARFWHEGVWDDDRDRLVVALGQDTAFNVFDDVWSFDPAAGAWSQLAEGGPAARYGACSVVDDDGRMIVSHGFSLEERFADTWAFDLATGSWADVTPSDGPRPAARCLHACAWDADAGALVLFGGRTDDARFVDDTWRLGRDGWQELPASSPSPRVHAGGTYVDDAVHLLGGLGPDGVTADAWTLVDDEWRPGTEGAPAARHSHAVAEREGQAWVFGGRDESQDLADLWQFG